MFKMQMLCVDVVFGILRVGGSCPHCAAYRAGPGSTGGMGSANALEHRGGRRGRAVVVFLLQEGLCGLHLFQ